MTESEKSFSCEKAWILPKHAKSTANQNYPQKRSMALAWNGKGCIFLIYSNRLEIFPISYNGSVSQCITKAYCEIIQNFQFWMSLAWNNISEIFSCCLLVSPTSEFLAPLLTIFIIFFVSLYGLLTKSDSMDKGKFLWGLIAGGVIYAGLVYGSTINESKTVSEIMTKFPSVLYGSVFYVTFVLIAGIAPIFLLFTRRRDVPIFLVGIVASFSIFEAYISLRCIETIPFLENLVKHPCVWVWKL